MSLIALKKLSKPLLDAPTRWSSIYIMLKSLLRLRYLCDELSYINTDFHVEENFWTKLSEVTSVLKHPADALQSLQKQNFRFCRTYMEYILFAVCI